MERLTPARAIVIPLLGVYTLVDLTDADLTPPPGDPMRRAVIDGLRRGMAELYRMDMSCVVQYLKMQDGWAWIVTLPGSPDGAEWKGCGPAFRIPVLGAGKAWSAQHYN